ncbi:MAG: hypothetical protein H7Y04_00780, partial [Verrucomicrobia bacterium]|nr:hypothetical protein [Cytophagales bacterium]
CWQGSGYVFTAIHEKILNGTHIYTGVLRKGTDEIHTAWWFDNGDFQTIHPLEWRWVWIKTRKPFYLINVNSRNKTLLTQEIAKLLSKNSHEKIRQYNK